MNRIRIVLIAVAAVLLALPPVFGFFTESQVHERVASLNADGTLAVDVVSYDRGWFTSTALITVAPPPATARSPADAGTDNTLDPVALLLDRPLDVQVDFSHGPVSLRDGFFVGASEFVARPAEAADAADADAAAASAGAGTGLDAGSGAGAGAGLPFEFHGQSTFSGELHFLAVLPALDRSNETGAVSFSGGRMSGTLAGKRITARGQAVSLQATNGLATLSMQGMTASADNEILSQWLAPGTFELTVERISLDASSGDIQAADLPAFDIAGLELRTLVRLDAERNSVDGSASIALGSARFGADTRISSARLDVAARRLDAAALEAARLKLEEPSDTTPAADEMGPIVERLVAAGPSITVNPLRFDMDGAPFEATLHAEALPQALPAGPIDLRRVDLWRNVLRGNARLTAEKGLVERAVAAVLKSQLASQYADESSIPREAVDTMASAQAGLVLAMLGAQGIVEDGGSVYRAELRLEDGALTINGRPLPLGLF